MDDEQVIPGCRLSPLDVVISTLAAFAGWLDDIVDLLMRHANYKVEQRTMEREARESIEKIVSGE